MRPVFSHWSKLCQTVTVRFVSNLGAQKPPDSFTFISGTSFSGWAGSGFIQIIITAEAQRTQRPTRRSTNPLRSLRLCGEFMCSILLRFDEPHEADVDELPAAGLVAVHGDQIFSGLERVLVG